MMSSTLEHAISDDAAATHEQGHAVATALQRALKGSSVEFGFPGIVTAHLASGAVARCGGAPFRGGLGGARETGPTPITPQASIPPATPHPKHKPDARANG